MNEREKGRFAAVLAIVIIALVLVVSTVPTAKADGPATSVRYGWACTLVVVGWWNFAWLCILTFTIIYSEHDTQVLVRSLALGASASAAIALACPPCAPIAGYVAATIALSAAYVAWVDSLGGGKGVYETGFYGPSPYGGIQKWGYMWHNG